ncbi:MAG: kelch repeat-containing protein [Kiritimatiellia bacterium]
MKKLERVQLGNLPVCEWVCWDRPPVMYVCYDTDVCSYYPMDTGIEAHGPFPLFSWEYAMAADDRGSIYVTGGHDENLQVRVEDPYAVGHKPPFPDSFFGPMISEMWHYDVRRNAWREVDQQCWGPRQCIGGRHMTFARAHNCLIRMAACREGHTPRPPVPLRGWGLFGFWKFEIATRRWTWMLPFKNIGPLTYDSRRDKVLGYKEGQVGVYDVYSNAAFLLERPARAPAGEGAFVYDASQDICLFYGETGETWVYDIEKNEWFRRSCHREPPARSQFTFAMDPDTGTALLFGGKGSKGFQADTWLYSVEKNEWAEVRCSIRPEARFWAGPGMVFDRSNRAFVLYGGIARYPRVKARMATGDVWVFRLPPRTQRAVHASTLLKSQPRGAAEPAVPKDLVVSVLGNDKVELSWKPSSDTDVIGYRVRRIRVVGDDRFVSERFFRAGPEAQFRDRPPRHPVWHYQYQVQAISRLGLASGWSAPASTIPSAPARLELFPDARRGAILLRWPANPEKGIIGYNIYRWVEPPFRFAYREQPELIVPVWWHFDPRKNPAERMQWVKVNEKPIRGTRYLDRGLKRLTTWYYIRAVNLLGVEGHFRTTYSLPVWRWYARRREFF